MTQSQFDALVELMQAIASRAGRRAKGETPAGSITETDEYFDAQNLLVTEEDDA